ncbi:sn-glycerol-3-phosphate ABC transporter ATP-binding protein UgpC [Martelella alba]|uniref:sn-glycerol-3-phosphate ABC transporter ATP-binding protein UgpC n=1 Tax=Martelella alba TaxID=2590451 RepID=A0A506U440_9HYPH|nr:sn-glycerol-3-phosphate ABC transporter ATP-binding protein UgpC [Martelella alba]TPW29153.1 sn-glycerol-3-phosphate ABC transporter ATP-binding protein UgpC [Martelella alba]
MSYVTLDHIAKDFGPTRVIDDLSLSIEKGEFVVFVGPSGCGKSTLLRLIAGLEQVSGGSLLIDGTDITHVDSANRGIAMVFQSYALYPHMTVAENITFGMRMNKVDKALIAERLARAAAMLHLEPLQERKPAQLSGGQRQRVAIGRAIVRDPSVFLFDEPLSNLDAALRHEMRVEILKLHRDLGATMIYVTHDQVEAMTMADKIVVLSGGRIEQVGAPLDLYLRPANRFVAEFLGSPKINCIETTVHALADGIASLLLPGDAVMAFPVGDTEIKTGDAVTLAIRPEHFVLDEGATARLSGTVELVEHLGSETLLTVRVDAGTVMTVKVDGVSRVRSGDQIRLGLTPQACQLFSASGETLVFSTIAAAE